MGSDIPIPWRWVGLFLGLAVFGPVGAIIGWVVGRKLDKRRDARRLEAATVDKQQEVVAAAVVALAAKLSKADGLVTADEIRTFKQVFRVRPPDEKNVARLWEEARASPYGFESQAWQLAQAYKTRPVVLEQIFLALHAIASADEAGVTVRERRFLEEIARIFHLRDVDVARPYGPWSRYSADHESNLADVSHALHGLIGPGAETASGRTLDRIEAGSAGIATRLGRWRTRLAEDPRARRFVAAVVGLIVIVPVHNLFFARPFLGLAGWLWSGAIGGAVGLATWLLLRPRIQPLTDAVAEAARRANLDPDQVRGAIADAEERIAAIKRAAASLDQALRRRVNVICDLAAGIVDGLRDDPSDLQRSRRVLGHYLVAVEDLVRRYTDLAASGAQSERLQVTLQKFEPVLTEIEDLFRKQQQRNIEDDALKLDVELDVLRKTIKSEAI